MQGELTQNPQRYTKLPSGGFQISASEEIQPITLLPIGEEIVDWNEGLDGTINSVIIWIEDTNTYLVSSGLLAEIESNPHFSYRDWTPINGRVMGKSIPVIKITTANMIKEIERQKEKVKNAGVSSIEFSIDLGNPESISGLIQQINWTLSNSPKPLDSYSVWDISNSLTGDYSITPLDVVPLDENAKIPEEVLASNLDKISKRLSDLRSDFNKIKKLFYFGQSEFTVPTRYTILASADVEEDSPSIQVVTKESTITSNQSLPSNQLADKQSQAVQSVTQQVENTQTTLSQRISSTEASIQSAQSGDAKAQSDLAAAQKALREQLKALQDKFTTTPTN